MNQSELRQILVSKFSFQRWKEILPLMLPKVEYFTKEVIIDHDLIKSGGQIGTAKLSDGLSLAIFKFEVADNILISRNRKGLRDIAARYIDQSLIHGAFVFYYSEQQADYRLTYIAKQTYILSDGQLKTTETSPKRYTFLLGENERCTTASIRLYELINKRTKGDIQLFDITDAFSVERLNKDFFEGYRNQYKNFLSCIGAERKDNRDYVKKLLGRLVFLQFLQKKGWMGVPVENKNWDGGDTYYLHHLVERYNDNNRLLSDILEPLFFETLNEKREGDVVNPLLGDNIRIPYLNGGLFDQDKLDRLDIDFPYSYFRELMEFFSMYNFTIDENDPDDSEVGIDPEMLGHIFENLLEDNKDKGAFYTPKEIVQYMSRESIIQYLQTHTDEALHPAIEILIKERRVQEILQNKATANEIDRLLKEVKVCDPAIGSGAFPMGVLNVLYHCRQLLYGFMQCKQEFSPASVKREIIQNNIFGVDIEQGAVDIARLRFWLALVVDEIDPKPLPNLDYKIMRGDSLLSRFGLNDNIKNVFADYNREHPTDKFTFERFKKEVNHYTGESDHQQKEQSHQIIERIKNTVKLALKAEQIRYRQSIQASIYELEHEDLFGNTKQQLQVKKDKKKKNFNLKELKTELERLLNIEKDIVNNNLYRNAFEWRFEFPALLTEEGAFSGFDIVIGNPPYLRIQGIRDVNSEYADELVRKYKSATGSFDLYALFTERGLRIIKSNGIVNYIMPVKWTNAAFGKGLRNVVSGYNSASKIINFGAYQVFNASTYTGLQWFKPNTEKLQYFELGHNLSTNQELDKYLNSLSKEEAGMIPAEKLKSDVWILTVGQTTEILNRLNQHPRRICNIFDRIFCGLQTSKDDVYFLYKCTEKDGYVIGDSKYLGRDITIERGLVKPLLKGEDVHRYDNISTDRFVIFPYKLEDGKANLYTEDELSELYPKGYSYLKECESELRGREKGRLLNDDFWYRYIYPKNLVLFDNEKLVAPEISLGGNFAYDQKGVFYSTTKIYGYIKKESVKESYKFWLGLFNSRLFWFYLQNTGYVLRGGYFTFKTNYINPFPVPAELPSIVDDIMSNFVDMLIFLYDDRNPNVFDHTPNKRIRVHIEDVLNMVVYELYFGEHMKKREIDVIADLKSYKFDQSNISKEIENFYSWYQRSENMVRQKLMLLDTRSNEFIYLIHTNTSL